MRRGRGDRLGQESSHALPREAVGAPGVRLLGSIAPTRRGGRAVEGAGREPGHRPPRTLPHFHPPLSLIRSLTRWTGGFDVSLTAPVPSRLRRRGPMISGRRRPASFAKAPRVSIRGGVGTASAWRGPRADPGERATGVHETPVNVRGEGHAYLPPEHFRRLKLEAAARQLSLSQCGRRRSGRVFRRRVATGPWPTARSASPCARQPRCPQRTRPGRAGERPAARRALAPGCSPHAPRLGTAGAAAPGGTRASRPSRGKTSQIAHRRLTGPASGPYSRRMDDRETHHDRARQAGRQSVPPRARDHRLRRPRLPGVGDVPGGDPARFPAPRAGGLPGVPGVSPPSVSSA